MKFALLTLTLPTLLVLGLTACGPKNQPKNQVTGKGNGGNGLAMSKAEIKKRVDGVKPHLIKLFEGLRDLNEAEKTLPGTTDLSEFPKVRELISKMISPSSDANIFEDIKTENNLDIADESCIDFQGFENVGAAKAGEIHGPVCISISELRKISPKGAETAVDIQILSIAAHEFGHHYLNSKKPEEDENLLRTLQAFVNYQLHKFDQLPTEGVVSTKEMPFLDRFVDQAAQILEQTKASAAVKEG